MSAGGSGVQTRLEATPYDTCRAPPRARGRGARAPMMTAGWGARAPMMTAGWGARAPMMTAGWGARAPMDSARFGVFVQRFVHFGDERRQSIDRAVRALDDLRVLPGEAGLEQVQAEP